MPPAADDQPPPPSLVDALDGTSYRALRQIGKGASGIVYEAEHTQLLKRFVVKVLRAEKRTDAVYVDRMRVEAQALGRIESPHVVQVTDCGITSNGRPFYVMEQLAGRTLRDELKQRVVLPVAEALEVARQVLEALRVVHAARLVHRDIKPENIFYCDGTSRRIVKLLDFGIVKVLEGDQPIRAPIQPTDLGVAIGTPRYFAPEQAHGIPADARADLYSVGVLMFIMLVGRGPFDGKHTDLVGLFEAHISKRPELASSLAPQSVPAAVDAIIARALEKAPDDRFASAADFLAAIDAAEHSASLPAEAPSDDDGADAQTTKPVKRWPATTPIEVEQAVAPRRARFGTEEMPQIARAAFTQQQARRAALPSPESPLPSVAAPNVLAGSPQPAASAELEVLRRSPGPLRWILIGGLLGAGLAIVAMLGARLFG